jgi:hypothetical protein
MKARVADLLLVEGVKDKFAYGFAVSRNMLAKRTSGILKLLLEQLDDILKTRPVVFIYRHQCSVRIEYRLSHLGPRRIHDIEDLVEADGE